MVDAKRIDKLTGRSHLGSRLDISSPMSTLLTGAGTSTVASERLSRLMGRTPASERLSRLVGRTTASERLSRLMGRTTTSDVSSRLGMSATITPASKLSSRSVGTAFDAIATALPSRPTGTMTEVAASFLPSRSTSAASDLIAASRSMLEITIPKVESFEESAQTIDDSPEFHEFIEDDILAEKLNQAWESAIRIATIREFQNASGLMGAIQEKLIEYLVKKNVSVVRRAIALQKPIKDWTAINFLDGADKANLLRYSQPNRHVLKIRNDTFHLNDIFQMRETEYLVVKATIEDLIETVKRDAP